MQRACRVGGGAPARKRLLSCESASRLVERLRRPLAACLGPSLSLLSASSASPGSAHSAAGYFQLPRPWLARPVVRVGTGADAISPVTRDCCTGTGGSEEVWKRWLLFAISGPAVWRGGVRCHERHGCCQLDAAWLPRCYARCLHAQQALRRH